MFLKDGYFNPGQVSILNRKVLTLLEDIRPNAVALVDAFDYPDQLLQSCLGRYDGQVYEALYNYAKSSPLNDSDVSNNVIVNNNVFIMISDFTNLYSIILQSMFIPI